MDADFFEDFGSTQPVHDYTADDLALWVPPVAETLTCGRVVEILTHNPEFPSIAVIDADERVLGLVSRTDFMTILAKPFTREVYDRKPIRELMDAEPLIVEASESINNIGRRIVQEVPKALEKGFVVIRDGVYVGVGTAVEFLRHEVDLVHRRTQQLEEARRQAVEASKAKSSFLANMSHEIRTPLNGVIANLELLKFGRLEDRQREMVDGAELAANTLLQIVGDILDFSKIEAGRLEIEQIDMSPRQVVQEVCTLLKSRAEQADITLKCILSPDVPDQVLGDPLRLRQILMNLAGNAIKFTQTGGVWLFVSTLSPGEHSVILRYEVSDTGLGFAPEKGVSLFDAFTQADSSTTRKFGGTGLGLAICKRLALLMGGRIANDGTPKGGASFYLDVPHVVLSPAELPDKAILRGTSIALLSDDARLSGRLEGLIGSLGATPVTLTDIDAAATLFSRDHGLGAAIVDMRLFGSESAALKALLSRLKSFNRSILLSPMSLDMAQRRRLLSLGFDRVLQSPFSSDMILAWLTQILVGDAPRRTRAETIDIASFAPWRDRAKVLVLEDMPMNQMVVRRQFDLLGLPLTLANHGREGLALVQAQSWDVIFSDVQMPEMDGFAFTEAVRAWEAEGKRKRLPIIAMTANALQGDAQKCLDAGMDDYLSKPVTIERLMAALHRWLPPMAARDAALPARTAAPPLTPVRSPTGPRAVDLDQFRDLVGTSDPAVARDLLGFFLEAFPELLAGLHAAALTEDAAALRTAAHAAKGAALNAAARPLGDTLATLEHQAAHLSPDQVQEILEETRARWKETADFIEQFINSEAAQ